MFTGGGLFDIGARQAGYEPIWGIEWDDNIASVARLNDLPVHTWDVTTYDLLSLHRPDHLHASPPCPNFSIAKQGGVETEFDRKMAESVARAIIHFQPDTFTLENVPAYVHSRSFKIIRDALQQCGYFFDVGNINAADFGVPQTRLRLWVRASKQLLMPLPAPEKRQGWYQAIRDLIPELSNSEFAPWQVARLPKEYKDFILGQGTRSLAREKDEPTDTITANRNQNSIRAFITDSLNYSSQRPNRFADEPIFTQTVYSSKHPAPRAYVGHVVKMNIQALGRFQTVPDDYKGLTTRINGNGVPCLLAEKLMKTLA